MLNVPERQLGILKAGQACNSKPTLPGEAFTGDILRIAPTVDRGGTFRVTCQFRDKTGTLQAACSAASTSSTTTVTKH